MEAMKIAVMGAGAVGCFYGGMLARAGHEVVLIGRPSHVESIQKQGLLLETLAFTERVAASAGSDPALVHDAALVLCCVKSNDTAAAATAMAPFLSGDAVVLSLQNGVDNAQQLSTLLGREVFPAVVYVAAEMAGAGHVRHHGRGELLIGPSPHAERLVTLFATAGVSVQISGNVSGALWTKLIINCVINALSAITRLPYGPLAKIPGMETVMRDVLAECQAVAKADGIDLPDTLWASIEGIMRSMPTQRSSTAQDVERGKRSEIDHLNGYMVERGRVLGVATPVNRMLQTLVRGLEKTP